MANPLLSVPGLGGYVAQRQMNEQGALGQLQQAQAVLGLQGVMEKRAQEEAFRQELAQAPDDAARQAIALKYASPDKQLDVRERAATRKDATEARAEQFAAQIQLRRDALEQQRDLALSRAQDKASQDAINNQFKERMLAIDGQNRAFYQWAARENIDIKRIIAANKPERPMTEFQGKSSLYGTRAAQSDKILTNLEEKVSTTGLAVKQFLAGTPVIGGALGAAGNVLLSTEQQRVEQAQRDFVNAVLRQESGAVISDAEFENAKKQYFPAPGDDKATRDQKRENRKLAIRGFARMAGPSGAEDINAIMDAPLIPTGASPAPQTFQEGQTATGPNGQKAVFRNGQWVPAR